jgi:hypothetical protein
MTTKPEKADEDLDALEALASEEKEFNKVSPIASFAPPPTATDTMLPSRMQKLTVS